jgi:FtsP/CotA-like multicopper oxidase with cupredoxin domain
VVGRRLGKDTQLSGAFIIDPRDGARVPDGVLVITGWNSSTNNNPTDNTVGRIVINSKSWPNTERLTYDVNATVRLRVLNVGNLVHPMHLHGFYFRVVNRTGFVGGLIPREDQVHGPTKQVLPRAA